MKPLVLNQYIRQVPTKNQLKFLLRPELEVFFGGSCGGGKAQPLDALVYTPYGPRCMKDMKVGQRVCTPDGSNAEIIAISPQGVQDIYRVTFSDRTHTECTLDHLWQYSIANRGKWVKSKKSWKIATTEQLRALLEKGQSPLIPLTSPVQFTKSYRYDFKQIDPYLYGVLLGDGCLRKQVTFTSIDNDIVVRATAVGEWVSFPKQGTAARTYCARGETFQHLRHWLKKLGAYGKYSYEKNIHPQYLFSNSDIRLEVLRGLMDTDGTVDTEGCAYFATSSPQLAKDVQFLVQSLGGRATISQKIAGYRDADGAYVSCRDTYSVYVRMPDNSILFHLPRKKELANVYNAGRMRLKRRIVSIDFSRKAEAQCIKLDSLEGLYLTDNFIVTHNSSALLMSALLWVHIPNYHAIIIRDTLKNLEQADALIPRSTEWLGPTDAQWKEQKHQWVFPNGSTLTFGYMDGPRDHFNYQGAAFQFVGIDEAVAIREHQADYMFSRMRRLEGVKIPLRIRLASNPPAREQVARGAWVKRRYVDKRTRKEGALYIPSRLQDNPYLDQEEYKKSLMNLDPITREQLLNGDWEIQAEGGYFQAPWFRFVDNVPEDEVELRVRYWDMAATEEKKGKTQQPDQTVGVRMCRTKNKQWYLESVVAFRKTPRDTEAIVRQVADMDGKNVPIRMEMEGGSGGKITIDHYTRHILPGFDFRGDKPQGKKTERAAPFASQMEAGNIHLVRAAWNAAYMEELLLFPMGEHDDQVDASSGAFNFLTPGKGGAPRVYVF